MKDANLYSTLRTCVALVAISGVSGCENKPRPQALPVPSASATPYTYDPAPYAPPQGQDDLMQYQQALPSEMLSMDSAPAYPPPSLPLPPPYPQPQGLLSGGGLGGLLGGGGGGIGGLLSMFGGGGGLRGGLSSILGMLGGGGGGGGLSSMLGSLGNLGGLTNGGSYNNYNGGNYNGGSYGPQNQIPAPYMGDSSFQDCPPGQT